ncbi:hypothetical protein FAI40_10485 (plasmid) [Acetobacteraceae bacterium]|nr:hypothetical protein FAI40_10380 [Acetobacteraceae bacterium]QCE35847.1 hypothetical protein FAI40_10485 [Acetobacteraceae bacterium]
MKDDKDLDREPESLPRMSSKEAMSRSMAHIHIEGINLPEDSEEIIKAFANDEISLEELLKKADENLKRKLALEND